VIAKIFVKPGTAPPARKSIVRYGLSSGAGDTSCFSDSTSVSMGGTSASSAPRQQLPDTSSLFAVAHAAADGESSSYGAAANSNNNAPANCRELVPCFSNTAQTDATLLGIGQYDPTPLAFEPPLAFFQSSRTVQADSNFQLPTFFSGGLQSGVSPLSMGGGAFQYWPSSGYEMKLEGAVGRAPAQMAVGPGLLDGSGWNF
jgi:hypothetical protein